VFSMDGSIAPLKEICDLADRYGALVMVDDSHATGFMGAGGRGSIEHCGVLGRVDFLTGTFGKALGGGSGGYTSGKANAIAWLRQRSRPYLFSNSIAPPVAGATLTALDLTDVVITADALHTQREHVETLAARGAHWVLTVKGNQPRLRRQLAGLPWRQVEPAHRSAETAHGRREIRTLKVVTIAAGIAFPYAAQAVQIVRRTRPDNARTGKAGRWRTETVYAITDLAPHQASPAELAAWIRGHWQIENALHRVRDVTFAEDLSQVRTGHAPQVMASLRNLVISLHRLAGATNIAKALRHHARDALRPLRLVKII